MNAFFPTSEWKLYIYLPEEAAVVDDAGTVGGGAVADLSDGGGETSEAVGGREVVPALDHGVGGTRDLLCSCESGVGVVVELCSEVGEGGV